MRSIKLDSKRTVSKKYLFSAKYLHSSLFIKQDNTLEQRIKSEDLLDKQNNHQIVYTCKDKQTLTESSSQIRIFSIEESSVECSSHIPSALCDQNCLKFKDCKLFKLVDLTSSQLKECENSCYIHKLDTFFLNDTSFFFDYLPISNSFPLSDRFVFVIETEYFCSFLEKDKLGKEVLQADLEKKEQEDIKLLREEFEQKEELLEAKLKEQERQINYLISILSKKN